MRIISIVFPVLFLCAMFHPVHAQEPQGRFDPVLYLKRIDLGDRYSDGAFLNMANTDATFENYRLDKDDVIAFTLKQSDTAETGWTMWLDFAMDRFGAKRLTHVFAQKSVPEQPQEEYEHFVNWIAEFLSEKLGAFDLSEKDITRCSYGKKKSEMALRLTLPQENGTQYITLEISELPSAGN